jgi:hypothetical protein
MNPSARRSLKVLLRELGLVEEPVNTLAHSLFPELPQIVAYAVAGTGLPAWVNDEWREPRFVEQVRRIYTDPDFAWRRTGQYVEMVPHRQLLAYYATEHETFTAADVFRDLPVSEPRFAVRYAQDRSHRNAKIRPFGATIVPVDGDPTMFSRFTGVRCLCGRIADIVARVPEVPRNLLCECGRMPDAARYGVDPNLRFPTAYRSLRLERAYAEKRTQLLFETMRTDRLSTRCSATLSLHEQLTQGVTERELADAVGVRSHLGFTMVRLEKFGYVLREGAYPAIWRYTEEGAAFVVRSGLVTEP